MAVRRHRPEVNAARAGAAAMPAGSGLSRTCWPTPAGGTAGCTGSTNYWVVISAARTSTVAGRESPSSTVEGTATCRCTCSRRRAASTGCPPTTARAGRRRGPPGRPGGLLIVRTGRVWEPPVLRHVVKALRALEDTSAAGTDSQLRLEAEVRITGSRVQVLGNLVGQHQTERVPRHLARLVLVMAPQPPRLRGALVATLRHPVQQAVVGHRGLEAAGGRYVGPVDGPVR